MVNEKFIVSELSLSFVVGGQTKLISGSVFFRVIRKIACQKT